MKNTNKNSNKRDQGSTETIPLIKYVIVKQDKILEYNEKEQKLKVQVSNKRSNIKSNNIINLTLKGNIYIYTKKLKKK